MLILGIDPGTGKSSPTGIAVVEVFKDKLHLIHTGSVAGTLHEIVDHVATFPHEQLRLETFVMQGKAGQLLNRLNGAILYALRRDESSLIHTMTVKKRIGGTGKADKKQVAKGILKFNWIEDAKNEIRSLIREEKWDQTDAIAIALCALTQGS